MFQKALKIVDKEKKAKKAQKAPGGTFYGKFRYLIFTDVQLVDDLNGILTSLQKQMLRVMLKHIDAMAEHIKEPDDDIDRHMKDEEKLASARIQEIPGIGNTSAEAIISVIGADMSRFPTDKHISKWAGLCLGNKDGTSYRAQGKNIYLSPYIMRYSIV